MNKISSCFFLRTCACILYFCSIPVAGAQEVQVSDFANNLVAYYPFDDGLPLDKSGKGNNGVITGSAKQVAGRVNNAIKFDATGYASIPVAAGSELDFNSEFSVSYWLKTDFHESNRLYVGRSGIWGLGTNNVGNGNNLTFGVSSVNALGSTYDDNRFFHIVFVYQAATKKGIFYNNKIPIEATLGDLISNKATSIIINGIKSHYLVTYDEMRFYNKMLSPQEVKALYDFGLSNGAGALYTLNVYKSGTGTGTISGNNISCGTDCFESVATNQTITLTPTPSIGSTFTGWSGGCSGLGSCTFTVSTDAEVIANFAANSPAPDPNANNIKTVKKTGGGDFTSLQACLNAATAGWTCEIYAATYNENLIATVSGKYSAPIILKAAPGEEVKIDSVNFDAADFIRLQDIKLKSIRQWGIEYIFNDYSSAGLYANDDYWVKGPVTISQITPSFNGTNHGWEVNPVNEGPQGFDKRADNFSATLVPSLPYTARPGQSIVKSLSRVIDQAVCTPTNRPCLQTAAVLTVVADVPVYYGSKLFRPPYAGATKAAYPTTVLRTELLPSFVPTFTVGTISATKKNFERVQLDHKSGETGRVIHPAENMGDYGADLAVSGNSTAMRLMLNESIEDKMPLLIPFVQAGIDEYHIYLTGQDWRNMGGHSPGRRLILAFAATLLDNAAIREMANRETFFNEDGMIYMGKNEVPLYGGSGYDPVTGEPKINVPGYWGGVSSNGASGDRGLSDPYQLVDGGPCPSCYYQSVLSQPYKGAALAGILMPALQDAWNPQQYKELKGYADRWVTLGAWAQPDPCAPIDQGGGANTDGNCVLDPDLIPGTTFNDVVNNPQTNYCQVGKKCGRFPDAHATKADTGNYTSGIVNNMWKAFRSKAVERPKSPQKLTVTEN